MSLVGAIVALCKALPTLERLFLSVSDAIREAKAKARYEAKLTHIDNAMRLHGLPDGAGRVRQHQEADGAPSVSEGGNAGARLHQGRAADDSRT
jgi:hypothetical protein